MKTIKFDNVYIRNGYTLLGRNEYNPVIKNDADKVIEDYYMNEKCVELAECDYQIEALKGIIKKTRITKKDIDLVIGGDLQNQLFASSYAMRRFDTSFIGVYSACSTFTESLLLASSLIETGKFNNIVCLTSSHNLASEKQFRFPIEYGAIRKMVNTFTATGSVSALVCKNKGIMKIESGTFGSIVDLNFKDANNFGACMAPAAAETIYEHLTNLKRKPEYYDLILTGDLGIYGQKIMRDYLKTKYNIVLNNTKDAGVMLFNTLEGDKIAGGSGPTCLPLILFTKLRKLGYKKILLVGTGSLHSLLSCNIKESIVSISHAVGIEIEEVKK